MNWGWDLWWFPLCLAQTLTCMFLIIENTSTASVDQQYLGFFCGRGSMLKRVNRCLAVDISAAPLPVCPPQAIEGAIGGNAYQHSKVNQWTTSVVEQTLSQLTKLGKPFKYIGELSFPFSVKAGTVKCTSRWGVGEDLRKNLVCKLLTSIHICLCVCMC